MSGVLSGVGGQSKSLQDESEAVKIMLEHFGNSLLRPGRFA